MQRLGSSPRSRTAANDCARQIIKLQGETICLIGWDLNFMATLTSTRSIYLVKLLSLILLKQFYLFGR